MAATSDATLLATELIYLALNKAFGFAGDELARLQEEIDKISDRITDPDDDYGLDEVESELSAIGVEIIRE